MFNGTGRKSASPTGASPFLDVLAFTGTVKGGAGARKQLLPAAKSTCPHSFPGRCGNRRQFLRNVFQAACQNLPFYNSKCAFDAVGQGQGVEPSFPSWALIPASGRAGRREALSLVEPFPWVLIPVPGALVRGSLSDPTCWACSLGFTRKVGGRRLACARHHVTSPALALASGLI